MSLVFAAIAPHPPILIPEIGKNNLKKIKKTVSGLDRLEENLYASKPDTIIVISPHGHLLSESFTVNVNPVYDTDFKEFGDLTTARRYPADLNLITNVCESAKKKDIPLTLYTDPILDYGSSVPLFYLTRHLPEIKIIPVGYSLLEPKIHLNLGYLIKEEIMKTVRRVAVIASGDLSHALSTEAPAGFSPDGKKFDETFTEHLKNGNVSALVNLDPKFCESAAECGLRSFLILLGVLQRVNYDLKIFSYEGPFGVGYLTAEFVLK